MSPLLRTGLMAVGLALSAQQAAPALQDLQARFPSSPWVYTLWEIRLQAGAHSFLGGTKDHVESFHKAILILKDDPNERDIDLSVPSFGHLDEATVAWTLPGGKTQKASQDQFTTGTYGTSKEYHFKTPKLPAGSTLDYTWSATFNEALAGYGSRSQPSDAPVLAWHAELAGLNPRSLWVKNPLDETGGSTRTSRVDPGTGQTIITLDAPDPGPMPRLPLAPWTPEVNRIKWKLPWRGVILFSPLTTIGRFHAKVANRDAMFSNTVEKTALQLTQGLASDRKRAEAIYVFLQKEMKHLKAGEETGGLFGHGALNFAQMLERKEGTPESIAALMYEMLQCLHIESRMMLVHKGLRDGFDPEWIDSDEPFEMGLQVDLAEGPVWVFPQDPKRTFGWMSRWELNRPAIVVQDAPSLLVQRTPAGLALDNTYEDAWDLVVDGQGKAKVHFQRAMTGPEAAELRTFWEGQAAINDKDFRTLWGATAGHPFGTLEGGYVARNQEPGQPFRMRMDLDLKGLCRVQNGVVALAPWATAFLVGEGFPAPLPPGPRSRPIWVPYDQTVKRTLTIKVPPFLRLKDPLPAPAKAANALGTASAAYTLQDGAIRVEQTLTLAHGLHSATEAPALLALTGAGSPLEMPLFQFLGPK